MKKKWILPSLLFGLFCVFFFTLMITSISKDTSTTSKGVSLGENVILSENTIAGSTKENLDKILQYIEKDNIQAQNNMILNGTAIRLSKGIKVTTIKLGIFTCEIKTSDDRRWFIPSESLK